MTLRRFLSFIALVVLALAGPAQGVRAWTARAAQACGCGCGAPGEDACPCSPIPASASRTLRPDSRTPAGSPCSNPSSPCSVQASHASPGLTGQKQTLAEERLAKRPEARPWPRDLESRSHPLSYALFRPCRGPQADSPGPGSRNPQAALSVFRI
jgi:hypothetical protein